MHSGRVLTSSAESAAGPAPRQCVQTLHTDAAVQWQVRREIGVCMNVMIEIYDRSCNIDCISDHALDERTWLGHARSRLH